MPYVFRVQHVNWYEAGKGVVEERRSSTARDTFSCLAL